MSEVKDPALNPRDHIPDPVPMPIPPRNPYKPPFVYPVTTDPVEEAVPVDLAAELVASGHVEEVELTPGLEERVEAAMERMEEHGDVHPDVVTSAVRFEGNDDDTRPPRAKRRK